MGSTAKWLTWTGVAVAVGTGELPTDPELEIDRSGLHELRARFIKGLRRLF